MRFIGKLLLPVLVLAVAFAGAGYLRATRPVVEAEPVVEKIWNVRATALRFADHQPVLELFGELGRIGGRQVADLAPADVGGRPALQRRLAFDTGNLFKSFGWQYHQNAVSNLGQPLIEFISIGCRQKLEIHRDSQIPVSL